MQAQLCAILCVALGPLVTIALKDCNSLVGNQPANPAPLVNSWNYGTSQYQMYGGWGHVQTWSQAEAHCRIVAGCNGLADLSNSYAWNAFIAQFNGAPNYNQAIILGVEFCSGTATWYQSGSQVSGTYLNNLVSPGQAGAYNPTTNFWQSASNAPYWLCDGCSNAHSLFPNVGAPTNAILSINWSGGSNFDYSQLICRTGGWGRANIPGTNCRGGEFLSGQQANSLNDFVLSYGWTSSSAGWVGATAPIGGNFADPSQWYWMTSMLPVQYPSWCPGYPANGVTNVAAATIFQGSVCLSNAYAPTTGNLGLCICY